MKLLTVNFLTCAVKTCKASLSTQISTSLPPPTPTSTSTTDPNPSESPYPLHFRDATLTRSSIPYNALFIRNILPRVNWDALRVTANELGLGELVPEKNPAEISDGEVGGEGEGGGKGKEGDGEAEEEEEEKGAMDVDDQPEPSPSQSPSQNPDMDKDKDKTSPAIPASQDKIFRNLHTLLLETEVDEGKLACARCGFEYPIKEGVGNFLLPAHLV